MFGEYVPLGKLLPFLYRLTPMQEGLTPGDAPLAIKWGRVTLCPNICYENTVPHLIRRQVRQLAATGNSPDAIITITNDGWFWGSSQLDLHLACAIMRAVELRLPLLIAANTGFSASVNARGQVMAKGPRHATGVVWAELHPRIGPDSRYGRWGDRGAIGCALFCAAAALAGFKA